MPSHMRVLFLNDPLTRDFLWLCIPICHVFFIGLWPEKILEWIEYAAHSQTDSLWLSMTMYHDFAPAIRIIYIEHPIIHACPVCLRGVGVGSTQKSVGHVSATPTQEHPDWGVSDTI